MLNFDKKKWQVLSNEFNTFLNENLTDKKEKMVYQGPIQENEIGKKTTFYPCDGVQINIIENDDGSSDSADYGTKHMHRVLQRVA